MHTTDATPRLCYIDGPWAYFTTQPLADQWGDDWNDAPYEHNAGTPYGPLDDETFEIVKVAWDGDWDTPCAGHGNSPWSVQQINAGAVAWLLSTPWRKRGPFVIMAGTTLDRFCDLIREGGGNVYMAQGDPSC